MPKPYDHIRYVRRNDSPWALGIPANATLVSDTPYGREYGWNDAPDTEPELDLFDGIATLYPVDRRLTVHQFLASTFAITDEERDAAIEILQGKAASTIHVTGRGWGKTRRRWVWDRLVQRLLEEPLPADFWGNVHGYRMLDDTLGRDIIHTLTKGRA